MSDFRLEDEGARKPPPPPPTPLPPPFPPPGTPGSATPRRGREPGKRMKKIPWPALLLLSIAPIGFTVWVLLMPEEKRRAAFAKIPEGMAQRGVAAGAALVALLLLVFVVLPATRMTLVALQSAYVWFFRQSRAKRVVLFPAEAIVWLGWFLMQIVFAIDAILVVASGIALILFAIRILKPDLFPWMPG